MNDKWSNFECLDRVSILIDHLSIALQDGTHPGLDNQEKVKLYRKAFGALAELYQKIGEREFEQ